MPELQNQRHDRFCREYILDGNGSRSAIAAGYSARSAGSTAYTLLKNPQIIARLTELRDEVADRLEITADSIARRFLAIADADANELMSLIVGACRYCWGHDHDYHWRTQREFEAAQVKARDAKRTLPDCEGGFGFSSRAAPNPACPECDGIGQVRTEFHDTTKLSPQARRLYAGVKETQFGIEVKLQDQGAALQSLAKHVGMYRDDEAAAAVDRFAQAVSEITKRGSHAPLATDDEAGSDDEEEVEP